MKRGTKRVQRLGTLLVLAAGLGLVGCSDDEDEGGPGTDAGLDAGTDAGADGGGGDGGEAALCVDGGVGGGLGTLELQDGFSVCRTVALPSSISALAALERDGGFVLYGLDGTTRGVHALGRWPTLAREATPLFRVTDNLDGGDGDDVFLSDYLATNGTQLLAGWTRGFDEGFVALYDLEAGGGLTFVPAPGNFTAAGVPDAGFLLNGLGLGPLDAGVALYGLRTRPLPLVPVLLAQAEPPAADDILVATGQTALTPGGVAVFGFADVDLDTFSSTASLHAAHPVLLDGGLQDAAPFPLEAAPRFFQDGGLNGAAGFGEGVALDLGGFREDFTTYTASLTWVALVPGGASGVDAGAPRPVLTSRDTCSGLVLMAPMGEDLLVGVEDRCASDAGVSLVHLRRAP